MLDLKGKTALVTGIANKRSIAFGIAKVMAAYGVRLALTYLPTGNAATESKFMALVEDLHAEVVLPLDVGDTDAMSVMVEEIGSRWGKLHIIVHSIAGAKREDLSGRFSDTSLEGYQFAHEVSGYSLIGLVRAFRALLTVDGGSVVTLSYIGSIRVTPNYNVMGSAKAALEANVRYLAMELGADDIRINAVSAGPIRTLSAAGIRDFLDLLHNASTHSALKRNVEIEEVGQAVAFLASRASSGITGHVLFVDCGYNIYG